MISQLIRNSRAGYLVLACIFLLSGCATPGSGTGPTKSLEMLEGYRYSVGQVSIPKDAKYEIDAAGMLRSAMETSLREKGLLTDQASAASRYVINAEILDYEMGSAFKRWLLPGYGSTILSVHTEITDPQSNSVVAELEHRQMVGAGGFYTVGAWEGVFASVAADIVRDIERKQSGEGEDFIVNLDPWLETDTAGVPRADPSLSIHFKPLADRRDQRFRIGERHAAFKVSMGSVYTNRQVSAFLTEAIQNELLAAGHELRSEPGDINISGEVTKFWTWTDTTMTYWDVIGEVQVTLTVDFPATGKHITRSYTADAKERTYLWPGKDLVADVIDQAVKSLMLDIRKEHIWAGEI